MYSTFKLLQKGNAKVKKKKRAVVCETSRIRPGFQSALAVLLTYGRAAITFIHFVHLLVGINERY